MEPTRRKRSEREYVSDTEIYLHTPSRMTSRKTNEQALAVLSNEPAAPTQPQQAPKISTRTHPVAKAKLLNNAILKYPDLKNFEEFRAFWELCRECLPCEIQTRLDKYCFHDLGTVLFNHLQTEEDLLETKALLRLLFELLRSGRMQSIAANQYGGRRAEKTLPYLMLHISYDLSHSGAEFTEIDYYRGDLLFNHCLAMLQSEFHLDLYELVCEALKKNKKLLKDYKSCSIQFQLLPFNNARFLALGRLCSELDNQNLDTQTSQTILLEFFKHFDLQSFDTKYARDGVALQDLFLALKHLKNNIGSAPAILEAAKNFVAKNQSILNQTKYTLFLQLLN